MENLVKLSETLREIDDLCEKMIRTAIPVMKAVVKERDKILKTIKEAKCDLTDIEIRDALQEHSLGLVTDSKTVKREIESFINCIVNNDRVEELENVVFLKEVWCGDVYNQEGLDALRELVDDFRSQIEKCTLVNIIERVRSTAKPRSSSE